MNTVKWGKLHCTYLLHSKSKAKRRSLTHSHKCCLRRHKSQQRARRSHQTAALKRTKPAQFLTDTEQTGNERYSVTNMLFRKAAVEGAKRHRHTQEATAEGTCCSSPHFVSFDVLSLNWRELLGVLLSIKATQIHKQREQLSRLPIPPPPPLPCTVRRHSKIIAHWKTMNLPSAETMDEGEKGQRAAPRGNEAACQEGCAI